MKRASSRTRPPRGRLHPGWFFLMLWLALTAVAVAIYLSGNAY